MSPHRPTGDCPTCGRRRRLNAHGFIVPHAAQTPYQLIECDGTDRPPKPGSVRS